MKTELLLAFLASFGVSALMGPIIIPILRRVKAGQTEREDGPSSHLAKTGTPTMGGFIFLTAYVVVSFIFTYKYPETFMLIFLTAGFAAVGFVDDFIKVVLKRSDGLSPIQKTLFQMVVSAVYVSYLFVTNNHMFLIEIPFVSDKFIKLGWIGIPILLFVILGTVNGSNLTDGVDGLEATVSAAICAFFLAVSIERGSETALPCIIMMAALIGFLLYNVNKAKVFMGDTGSLAIGGFVVGVSIWMGLELYLPFVCFIYFAEALSVMIQVFYFKKTGGKRFFRMAPIHHHYELGGWSETKVVGVFTIVTIVLGVVSFIFV